MQVRGFECCSLKSIHDEESEDRRLSEGTAQGLAQWPSVSHQHRTRPTSSEASFNSSSNSDRNAKLELYAIRHFCTDLLHMEPQIAE